MLARVFSGTTIGMDSILVEVEVDISTHSLPAFNIVGLPNKAVEEAKERVRSAIKNTGGRFPDHRITVNLAPADIPKEGPAYDLPIALGLMIADGQLRQLEDDALFLGELSLDGTLRHTNGVLPMAILAKKEFGKIVLPEVNAQEAALVKGLRIFPITNLKQLFEHLMGVKTVKPFIPKPETESKDPVEVEFDMAEIKGQEFAKRALEIAAAGGHNVFLKGTPGAGKTMLARALPGILPRMTEEEVLEVTKIYSISGNLPKENSIIRNRPFRSPHHSTSRNGLIGGGTKPAPGEISLAHRGVLFLDEFPEFPRHVLESLRQPLEDGKVTISRASGTISYPSKFILVSAANPCPCGYLGDAKRQCICLPGQIIRYQKQLSGPLLDRIDLHVEVPAVDVDKLTGDTHSETSKSIQIRVQRARDIQSQRFKGARIVCNAEMSTKQVKEFCPLDEACLNLLRQAVATLSLSARGFYRTIKVARTISDLSGESQIKVAHLAESLGYRPTVL